MVYSGYQDKTSGRHFNFGLVLIIVIAIADQFSKWVVMESMLRTAGNTYDFLEWLTTRRPAGHITAEAGSFRSVEIFPWLDFTMVWNRGVSFGLFSSESELVLYILVSFALMVSLLFLLWLVLTPYFTQALAVSLIVGGALGNVIDRVRFGAVADFADFHVGNWHWPAFNLADACITAGAVLILADTLFRPKQQGPAAEKSAGGGAE